MHLILQIPLLLTALIGLSACPSKMQMRENHAVFDLASAHWFENEQTEYVFFSVSGLRTAQAKMTWPFAFELSGMGTVIPGVKTGADGFGRLDLSQGVHQHHFVECGDGRICGSFSFHATAPVANLLIRFRYQATSAMNEVASIPTASHPAGQGADSQSALIYGVYNHDNSRLQMRVHDNFGTPDSDQILQYGMNRTIKASAIQSVTLSQADEMGSMQMGGSFLFPAAACQTRTRSGDTFTFNGHQAWTNTTYDPSETANDACFQATMLDQKGVALVTNPGMARKNPVIVGEPMTLQPPVKPTIDIPIIVTYCPDAPDGANQVNPNFLSYQKFILGYDSKVPTDVCFQTGQETQFQTAFARVLDQKLSASRATNGSLGRDFFFRVIINHNLSQYVRTFHKIMSAAIRTKIATEAGMVSPRLVGAFVYDSQPATDVDIGGSVIWCPRVTDPNATVDNDPHANCGPPMPGGQFNLGPFNFQIPMGPFPTMQVFVNNFTQYGQKGQMNNPQFNVSSVQTNGNSVTTNAGAGFVTFFDGQRLDFNPGERLKLCLNRDSEGLYNSMAFQPVAAGGASGVLDAQTAQSALLFPTGAGDQLPSYRVGLEWTNAFIGTFNYDIPVKGKVFSVIPISITGKTSQNLGDPTWSKPVWNMTPLMQKCLRDCWHPTFDEAGVYQLNYGWTDNPVCTTPQTAEP